MQSKQDRSVRQSTNCLSTSFPADLRANRQDPKCAPSPMPRAHEHPTGKQDGGRGPPSVIWCAPTCPHSSALFASKTCRGCHSDVREDRTGRCGAAHKPLRIRPEKGRQAQRPRGMSVSRSTSATALTSVPPLPARPSSGSRGDGGVSRRVDIEVDVVWDLELELNSPGLDSAPARCDVSTRPGREERDSPP